MNVFLIVAITVALIILLVIAVYLLVYYQHPDDHNDAYAPKVVVILGFCLAGWTVLMFPIDVANNGGYAGCSGYDTGFCGGLPMNQMWDAVFWMIPIWIFILIPFATFYYEADDGTLMAGTSYGTNIKKRSRIGQALCYQTIVFIVTFAYFIVTYFLLSDSNVPVSDYTQTSSTYSVSSLVKSGTYYSSDPITDVNATFTSDQLASMAQSDKDYYTTVSSNGTVTMTLKVSISVFFAAMMAWLGWWLFALFGGIGLAALPLDLILAFVYRPRRLDAVEFAEAQMSLRERVNELVEIGELIKIEQEQKNQAGIKFSGWSFDADSRKAARDERQAILGFKQAVYLLEQDVEDFQAVTVNYEKYNPLIPFFSLLAGICAAILSIFWFLHICIYVYPNPPLIPFLNNYFKFFDSWFPLFGTLSVALFACYLQFCAVAGCFKFGIRFLCFRIHPMKYGKTYMSSFMFNIALVLFCSLPIVQFCQQAFAEYAAYATIRQIYSVQINNITFFKKFFANDVFIIILMSFNVLTIIYLSCRPRDKAANPEALRDRLRAHAGSKS